MKKSNVIYHSRMNSAYCILETVHAEEETNATEL